MIYVVPGYLYLSVYRYVLYKDKDTPTQTAHILLNSIIASFVLKTSYDCVIYRTFGWTYENSGYKYLFFILLVSLVLGFISARIITAGWLSTIFMEIGLYRTVSENVWDDVVKPDIWARIWLKDSDKSYYGQIRFMDNYEKEPIVVLENYQFLDGDSNVLVDKIGRAHV